ncbi:poly(A)-specific ribonuclease [Tulasnella sp. 418]|nr:poly(A)-specific ribonuclease [Tulasnella sp. 418]
MPHYSTPLLSGSALLSIGSSYHPPPAKIPEQVLNSMRSIDFVGYATLPKELRGKRNLAPKEVINKDEGRFRSKVSRGVTNDQPPSPSVDKFQRPEIPKYWRKTDIKYSKFGIEDFDFGFYNKTSYSGLETHIMNSYTNAIVQALFYTIPLRQHAKSHITIACQREHCLLCEFGFVSRMLEDAKGTNCQTSNFCKIIGRMPQALPLGLVDYTTEGNSPDYATMIQQFNRFLLEEMATEGDTSPSNPLVVSPSLRTAPEPIPSPVTQLFGFESKETITCGHCGAKKEKESTTRLIDLIYPRKDQIIAQPALRFTDLLSSSLNRDTTYKAPCQVCKHIATFRSRRGVPHSCLPVLLSINAAVFNEDQHQFWLDSNRRGQTERFLTSEVSLNLEGEGQWPVEYDLRAMVVEVRVGPKAAHLAAVVKIPTAELDDPSASPWFVFNDFVVENITEDEALGFPSQWKVPCVLYFERRDFVDELDYSGFPKQLDPAILLQLTTLSKNMNPTNLKHEVLRYEELPKPGTVVAIDAEFVALQQEETEFRTDGTKKVLRPSQLTLARVSVLRVVYKKLRLLVDLGCIFIGHGLSKDFRIINLFVPPEQVIDTVDLYFIRERQRRISLRFLSWYLLKETIQIDTHDSIEDARAALLLYQKYQQFEEEGQFDAILEEIYREGRKLNWKAPVEGGATSTPSKSNTPYPAPSSPPRSGVMGNPMMNPSAFLPSLHPAFSPPPHLQGLPMNFMDPRMMFAASWNSGGLPPQPQSPQGNGRR